MLADDYERAASRVFQAASRIIGASPLLRHGATITANRLRSSRLALLSRRAPMERRTSFLRLESQSKFLASALSMLPINTRSSLAIPMVFALR